MTQLTKDAVIFIGDPLPDISAREMRQWIGENDTLADLATAMAQAHNRLGYISHDLDELEGDELFQAKDIFDEQDTLCRELYDKIISILKEEKASGKSAHTFMDKGLHYVIKPFMERYGYYDDAGWWIKE